MPVLRQKNHSFMKVWLSEGQKFGGYVVIAVLPFGAFDGLWRFLMAFGGRCFPSKPSNPVKLHQIFFWWSLVVFGGLGGRDFSIKAVKSRQTSSNIFFDGLWWFLMAFGGRDVFHQSRQIPSNFIKCTVLKKVYSFKLSILMTGNVEPSLLVQKSVGGSMPPQTLTTV